MPRTMLAGEGPQIAGPDLASAVIVGGNRQAITIPERDVHLVSISRGGGGGEGVLVVRRRLASGSRLPPQGVAVHEVEAQQQPLVAVVAGRLQEDALVRDDGGRIAGTGNFDLPVQVL